MHAARDHQKAEELWKLEPKPNFNASTEKEKFKQQFEYNTKTSLRRTRSSEIRLQLSTLIRANKTFHESDCKSSNSNVNQSSGNTPTPEKGLGSIGFFGKDVSLTEKPANQNSDNSNKTSEGNLSTKKPKISLSEEDIESAKRLFNAGSYQFSIGNYQKAVESLTKSLEIRLDHSTYFKRAAAFDALMQYDKAIADFDQSIILNSIFTGLIIFGLKHIKIREIMSKA